MKRRHVILTAGTALICFLAAGCEDPPPPPASGAFILGVRTQLPDELSPTLSGGMDENLDGLTAIRMTIDRVDVVHRSDAQDPSTERVITVDSEQRVIEIVGDLKVEASRRLGFFTIPVGYVYQLRLIVSEATITLRGVEHAVRIPSGMQTGLKIEPIDGEPFEIREDERTGGRVVFKPFESLIRNLGQGFKLKPVMEAEHVTIPQLAGAISLDEIVVRFKSGVSQTDIDNIIANTGTTIITRWKPTSYYVLRLPATLSMEEALERFYKSDHVQYVIPNTVLNYYQEDPYYTDQVQWPHVGLDQAYARVPPITGSYEIIVAVLDTGVNYDHRDLVHNIWINEGELPAAWTADDDGDNVMNADFDGDGFITFADLNMAQDALTQEQLDLLSASNLIPPVDPADTSQWIRPSDLIRELSDGVDGDDHDGDSGSFVDDLVGWNFDAIDPTTGNTVGDQYPAPDYLAMEGAGHGTWVSGIIGARGHNGLDVAGVAWKVRIIPIRLRTNWVDMGDAFYEGPMRDSVVAAVKYAASLGAHVINMSSGGMFFKGPDPDAGCGGIKKDNIGSDRWGKFVEQLDKELRDMHANRPGTLLVLAAGNCGYNIDLSGTYSWPGRYRSPSQLNVTASMVGQPDPTNNDWLVHGASRIPRVAYGERVDMAAPGTLFQMLHGEYNEGLDATCDSGIAVLGCFGTSYSAPMVSGAAALLLSHTSVTSACELRERILLNGDRIVYHDPAQGAQWPVGEAGYRLNLINAVDNTAGVPSHGCP